MNVYPTIDMEATGNRIRDLRKENHIKVLDIATYMGFESQQADEVPDEEYVVRAVQHNAIIAKWRKMNRTTKGI